MVGAKDSLMVTFAPLTASDHSMKSCCDNALSGREGNVHDHQRAG